MEIWIPIVIGIVCLAAGFAGGYVYRRNIAEAKIANAEEAVKKMIGDAQNYRYRNSLYGEQVKAS